MKSKSNKISKAQAAHLAATITSREADAANHRADLAKVMFKKARKAYKQARKAAKRAAKRAKEAKKKLAAFRQILRQSKRKPERPSILKRPPRKGRPAAPKKIIVFPQKPEAEVISPEVPPTPPAG